MAVDIDVRAVASFTSTPESTISTILEKPTIELVRSLLENITIEAHENSQIKSQKVRLEVELETAVRTNESKVKALKTSVEKGLAETRRLRIELQNSENARTKAEHELGQIQSTHSQNTAEASSLKSRISSLEAANRDTLAVLESKQSSYEKLAEELSSQQQKAQSLRRRVSELEQNLQNASSAAASTRFREQSLQQELELLKRNNEWFESELKTKTADHLKFRKDKNARITDLQQLNEQHISDVESLRRSEATLRNHLDEQVQKFEDCLVTVQELREKAAQDADSFRVDLDSASRLAELQKKSAETAKQRAHELSIALEEAKDEAAEEVGRIRAEVETEHDDKVAAERFILELQQSSSKLEQSCQQLQAELDLLNAQPGTPKPMNGNGPMTPSRPSPATGVFSPNSAPRLKATTSMTQLFAEYKKVERELAGERRHAEQLSKSLEDMVENLEKTQPEIEELRTDHGRLSGEVLEISNLRDAATKEKDRAIRDFRKIQGQIQEIRQERDVYQQQVRDSSSQIKILLMEQHMRANGQEVTQEEMHALQKAAVGDEADLAAMTDTGRIISENLTVFRNIVELQEQNTKIQSMLRQLGERMEANEASEKDPSRHQEQEELQMLRARVSTYKDELQSMITQSKSYIKERDMFRNMLVRRGQLPAQVDPTTFAQSMPLPATDSTQAIPSAPLGGTASEESDYGKLLKDLQHHFDSYKTEAATDNAALRSQVDDLSKRNSQLQIDLSKQVGQLGAAHQRAEMLQTNYNMLKSESMQMQRRSDTARENATRHEIRTQQVAEELVGVRGESDNLRRETANLKAEKDLWKSIEKRLIQDNEDLRSERGRLDNLNSTLQNILNEREQSDTESHRRSQRQIESLESELQSTKRQLDGEIEEAKKNTLRREYEHGQNQKRIDDLMASVSSVREESIEAKTARDHLQARVDELTIELRSAEERLQMLQEKSTPKARVGEAFGGEEDWMAREQELSMEISELKRDLELKDNELERLKEQVETYKSISQSSEERLQELNESNDQFREEMERAVEEKNVTVKDLEQRVHDISSELASTNHELTLLRDEHSASERRLGEQKAAFEIEIRRLKDQVDQQTTRADQLLEDVKLQAKIASDHQESYDNELLKHADAAKALQTIRTENNQLRLDLVELRIAAESARTSLEQKEESWSEQKARIERELSDIRRRKDEVVQQNALLHGQLEEITKQLSKLQKDRIPLAEDDSDTIPGPALENLQEVIRYLRREKEIVDVQYHLSTQESKRLKQQLDHTQSQLDETRLKLDQQLRAEADVERNALSHNKLMDSLNELNLYRESSVTLRAEAKAASTALNEKSQRIEELITEVTPLRTRIAELENLAELREGEMKLLQEDRDHWQTRTQNILAKYDRVDPAELESLKQRFSMLVEERDQAVTARNILQEQIDAIPQQIEIAKQDLRARLSEQFKARNKDLTGRINQKQTELDTVNSQKVDLQTELDSSRERLRSIQDQSATSQVNGVEEEPSTSTTQESPSGQGPRPQPQQLSDRISELEAELAAKAMEIEVITAGKESAVKARENEMRGVLNKRLADVKAEMQVDSANALKTLEDKLQTQQAEMESLRAAKMSNSETLPNENAATSEQPPESQVTAYEPSNLTDDQARLLVKENETVRNILRANVRKSVDKAREELRKELEAARAASGSFSSNGFTEDMEKRCTAEKEKLVETLDSKFELERQAILRGQEEKCASEKQALVNEQEEKLTAARQTLIIDMQEKFSEERLKLTKDAQRKTADQVALVEKRTAAKMNLALNQAKNANAKIQAVAKAAEETAEKAVGEVWAIAKDAKPPPLGQTATPAKPATPISSRPQIPLGEGPKLQSDSTGPAHSVPTAQPEAPLADTPTVSELAPATEPGRTADLKEDQTQQQTGLHKPSQSNHANAAPAVARNLHSQLPRGNRGGRGFGQGQQHPQIGSSGETQQQAQQGAPRGSGIPRGGPRGRGQGRGGAQQVQTNVPHSAVWGQAGNSPRGAMNPQAKQFNPQGNKRGREDGSTDEQGGKRIRGGEHGS